MQFFPSRCPPSTKSGVGVYVDRGVILTTGKKNGQKKLHFVHSGQSYGGSKLIVSKNDEKVSNFGADLGVGSHFGPLPGKKG